MITRTPVKAYSLIELLLVIAILLLIAGIGSTFLFGQKLSTEMEEEAKKIAGVLRLAQSKATSRDQDSAWGVYFDNTGPDPFYELFRGASYAGGTVTDRFYLPTGVSFTAPAPASTATAIFNKRKGDLQGGGTLTITIQSSSPGHTKNIAISAVGRVNIQ